MAKIARYSLGGETHYGTLEGETLRRWRGSPLAGGEVTAQADPLASVTLLAPVAPANIYGVGLNYVSHIAEVGAPTPQRPMFFMKPTNAIVGPGAPVVYPLEGREVHYEAELAVVIGKPTRRVGAAEALDHVLGYTCANDISERVIQKEEMDQGCLVVGKGFDTFCPLGPVIATDVDPADLLLESRINGQTRQSIRTSDLLFSVRDLVVYLSAATTLLPGDVIITGTPAGIGPVAPGDRMEIELEGVGVLANPVVAEGSAAGA